MVLHTYTLILSSHDIAVAWVLHIPCPYIPYLVYVPRLPYIVNQRAIYGIAGEHPQP